MKSAQGRYWERVRQLTLGIVALWGTIGMWPGYTPMHDPYVLTAMFAALVAGTGVFFFPAFRQDQRLGRVSFGLSGLAVEAYEAQRIGGIRQQLLYDIDWSQVRAVAVKKHANEEFAYVHLATVEFLDENNKLRSLLLGGFDESGAKAFADKILEVQARASERQGAVS